MMIEKLKMKITTKSQIEKRQVGTKADSEQKDEDLFVSPNNAKPPVTSLCHLCCVLQVGQLSTRKLLQKMETVLSLLLQI